MRDKISGAGPISSRFEKTMSKSGLFDSNKSETHSIAVADASLAFRNVEVDDWTPTGEQLAVAAGFKAADGVSVLQFLPTGDLEDIRPTETVDLRRSDVARFVIVASDRAYRFTIDGQRFDWPCRVVSGMLLRKLGQLQEDRDVFHEGHAEADRRIEHSDLVDLDGAGVESFVSRKRQWKLNVQGVV